MSFQNIEMGNVYNQIGDPLVPTVVEIGCGKTTLVPEKGAQPRSKSQQLTSAYLEETVF